MGQGQFPGMQRPMNENFGNAGNLLPPQDVLAEMLRKHPEWTGQLPGQGQLPGIGGAHVPGMNIPNDLSALTDLERAQLVKEMQFFYDSYNPGAQTQFPNMVPNLREQMGARDIGKLQGIEAASNPPRNPNVGMPGQENLPGMEPNVNVPNSPASIWSQGDFQNLRNPPDLGRQYENVWYGSRRGDTVPFPGMEYNPGAESARFNADSRQSMGILPGEWANPQGIERVPQVPGQGELFPAPQSDMFHRLYGRTPVGGQPALPGINPGGETELNQLMRQLGIDPQTFNATPPPPAVPAKQLPGQGQLPFSEGGGGSRGVPIPTPRPDMGGGGVSMPGDFLPTGPTDPNEIRSRIENMLFDPYQNNPKYQEYGRVLQQLLEMLNSPQNSSPLNQLSRRVNAR
jgi:hypothetical protein